MNKFIFLTLFKINIEKIYLINYLFYIFMNYHYIKQRLFYKNYVVKKIKKNKKNK